MTRNEARGILIRMASEIENPYSTEAQALGIAIEKMERDYETEYWEAQWQIDQYEAERHRNNVKHPTIMPLPDEGKEYVVPSKKERAADALIRFCKRHTRCDDCPFIDAPFCQIEMVTNEGSPSKWDKGTCKVDNRPVDERKEGERIIYRLGKIEAQMDDLGCSVEYLKGVAEAQAERLAKIRKAFNE